MTYVSTVEMTVVRWQVGISSNMKMDYHTVLLILYNNVLVVYSTDVNMHALPRLTPIMTHINQSKLISHHMTWVSDRQITPISVDISRSSLICVYATK